jgi:hypothetical protein
MMRTPRSSIVISTPSLPFPSGLDFSILITGSRAERGGVGGFGGLGSESSIDRISVLFHENGGMFCRTPDTISSRIDSSAKRHQVRPTSQPA